MSTRRGVRRRRASPHSSGFGHGLYIAGGLTLKNLSLIEGASSPFMTAFLKQGLTPLLKRVPVFAVLAEDIGQRGAHLRGVPPAPSRSRLRPRACRSQ